MLMFKYKFLFLTTIFIFFLFPLYSQAKEHIARFSENITLNSDSSIDILETIKYDFSIQQKHGIFRTIPIKYKTDIGLNKSIKISNISIKDEIGNSYNFEKTKSGNYLKLKIGDAQKTITGIHTYEIKYTVLGAINFFDTHDELYWNVTGNEWNVPIDAVNVMVHSKGIEKNQCYKGTLNSTETCDKLFSNNTYAEFKQNNLNKFEGVTIAIALDKGVLHEMSFIDKVLWFLKDNLFVIIFPLIIIFGLIVHWWRNGRDYKLNAPIVPQWEVPDNLRPAEIGIIIDENFDPQDLSSMIIDLAVRKYITIKQVKTGILFFKSADYELTLLIGNSSIYNDNSLCKYEQDFLIAFFGNEKKVLVSSKKQKFSKEYKKIASGIYKNISKKYFVKNPEKIYSKYTLFGILFIISLHTLGMIIGNLILVIIGWIGGIFIIIGYGKLMIKRTVLGVKTKRQIEGLRLYLKTAEKRQIEFLNAPQKNAKHFEKLLPYAVALGVVKEWSEQFEDLIQNNPEWFDNGTATFNAVSFGSAMQSFSTSAANTMSSQASSGGSGFSGGGSGGGFGGGGGGSW